jgi:hypothetical protein
MSPGDGMIYDEKDDSLKRGWLKKEFDRTSVERSMDEMFAELRRYVNRPCVGEAIVGIIREQRRVDALARATELEAEAKKLREDHK